MNKISNSVWNYRTNNQIKRKKLNKMKKNY
jgi:hypothetical protein